MLPHLPGPKGTAVLLIDFLSTAPTSDSLTPWGIQDIETIDSLARAINNWDGGLVLVSHDFRLISQVRGCES